MHIIYLFFYIKIVQRIHKHTLNYVTSKIKAIVDRHINMLSIYGLVSADFLLQFNQLHGRV